MSVDKIEPKKRQEPPPARPREPEPKKVEEQPKEHRSSDNSRGKKIDTTA